MSVKFPNGTIVLQDDKQNQGSVHPSRQLKSTKLSLLHLRCTKNWHMSHWIAASLSLMFLLHNLHGKTILVFLEVDVLMTPVEN